VIVGVISKSDTAETVRLPLGAVGAVEPAGERDLLGSPLRWTRTEKHAVSLLVEPHSTYLFACEME